MAKVTFKDFYQVNGAAYVYHATNGDRIMVNIGSWMGKLRLVQTNRRTMETNVTCAEDEAMIRDFFRNTVCDPLRPLAA